VQIKMADNSAADISVDGVPLGKSPVNYTEGFAGKNSSYQVEATLPSGQTVRSEVKRGEMSMGALGVGAGAGVGACLFIGAVATVAGFIIPFGGLIGCAGCPALIAGPAAGFFVAGQSTDVVTIDPGLGALAPSSPPTTPPVDGRAEELPPPPPGLARDPATSAF